MTTTHRPTRVNATQQEKAEILRNDLRANTFAGRAIAEADDVRGRWAEINKSNVVGATPTPQYPAGPNWSVDPTGVEPPLNIDVNALEPVGEFGEVQASIEALGDETVVGQSASPLAGAKQQPPVSDPSTGGAAAPKAAASPQGEPPAIPTSTKRSR
jgi:hypothetical protein